MAVLGAGRYLPASTRTALCLDFGQTTIKRACLEFEDGVMVRVCRFKSLVRDVDELPTTATGVQLPELPDTTNPLNNPPERQSSARRPEV